MLRDKEWASAEVSLQTLVLECKSEPLSFIKHQMKTMYIERLENNHVNSIYVGEPSDRYALIL